MKKHMAKKSNVFTEKQVYHMLQKYWDYKKDEDLLYIIIVLLTVFGMLWCKEVKKYAG